MRFLWHLAPFVASLMSLYFLLGAPPMHDNGAPRRIISQPNAPKIGSNGARFEMEPSLPRTALETNQASAQTSGKPSERFSPTPRDDGASPLEGSTPPPLKRSKDVLTYRVEEALLTKDIHVSLERIGKERGMPEEDAEVVFRVVDARGARAEGLLEVLAKVFLWREPGTPEHHKANHLFVQEVASLSFLQSRAQSQSTHRLPFPKLLASLPPLRGNTHHGNAWVPGNPMIIVRESHRSIVDRDHHSTTLLDMFTQATFEDVDPVQVMELAGKSLATVHALSSKSIKGPSFEYFKRQIPITKRRLLSPSEISRDSVKQLVALAPNVGVSLDKARLDTIEEDVGQLTRRLDRERDHGVTINSLCPRDVTLKFLGGTRSKGQTPVIDDVIFTQFTGSSYQYEGIDAATVRMIFPGCANARNVPDTLFRAFEKGYKRELSSKRNWTMERVERKVMTGAIFIALSEFHRGFQRAWDARDEESVVALNRNYIIARLSRASHLLKSHGKWDGLSQLMGDISRALMDKWKHAFENQIGLYSLFDSLHETFSDEWELPEGIPGLNAPLEDDQ